MPGEQEYGLLGKEGVATLRMLNEQVYASFPLLRYRRLVSEARDRYNDSSISERKYVDFDFRMKTDVGPEDIGLGALTVDFSRKIVFLATILSFEEKGFDPKMGDVLFYDEAEYEVSKVYRQLESRQGYTNVYLNFVIETELQRTAK